jgi:hypothetical protein
MPSPNSVNELVIFAVGAVVFVIAATLVLRFTPWGRRWAGSLKNGPVVIQPRRPNDVVSRKNYRDPLAKINVTLVMLVIGIALACTFIFYFYTRQTLTGGN